MYLRKKMYSGKRLAHGQTHRRGSWRRVISVALCAVLLSTNMVGVCAADLFDDTSCICDVLCGDEGNSACPVCEEDPAQCAAKAQPPEPEETYIIGWTWVDEEEFLTEYDGEWYLSLPGAERDDLTEELLEEMLPKKLCVELSDGETEYLPITWDFSPLLDISQTYFRLDAEIEEGYVLDEDVDAPYVLLEYGGAELYAGTYPGTRQPRTDDDHLEDHTVQGITPAGTTVNLFDYDPQIGNRDNDVLPDGARFENYSKGINENALLLFGGSAMREAGFWNLGSGAGRPWGQNNVNMKGIVKSTLEDNYPYINLDQARSTLQNPTEPIITEDGPWGNPDRKLMDIANLNHAESENAGVDKARALSVKLLKDRGLTVADDGTVIGDCEKASLRYLFDPDESTDGKESHTNVTGLFQIDDDGYIIMTPVRISLNLTKSIIASLSTTAPPYGARTQDIILTQMHSMVI